eukprot:scaffold326086_cov61-Tisochrysis_lutea.AAC.1
MAMVRIYMLGALALKVSGWKDEPLASRVPERQSSGLSPVDASTLTIALTLPKLRIDRRQWRTSQPQAQRQGQGHLAAALATTTNKPDRNEKKGDDTTCHACTCRP